MDIQNLATVISVVIGAVILIAVIWKFIRNVPDQSMAITTTLILIGFLLTAGPIWSSIVIKRPDLEVRLERSVNGQLDGVHREWVLAETLMRVSQEARRTIGPAVQELKVAEDKAKSTRELTKRIEAAGTAAEVASKIVGLAAKLAF